MTANKGLSLGKHFLASVNLNISVESRLLQVPSLASTLTFIHIFLLLLHVSALVGHLQVEYTIIAGSY
jgi:hypothetical protein